jgi:hypothetical protein
MISAERGEGHRSSNVSKNRGNFREVSKRAPCPICGQPGWCMTADEGAVVICMRAVRDSLSTRGYTVLKPTKDRVGLILRRDDSLYSDEPRGRTPRRERQAKPASISPVIWKQRAAGYQMHMGDRRAALAGDLGVDEAALAALHCGWIQEKGVWTFPERDATGAVVGISTRLAAPIRSSDGKVTSKKMITGSHHGLFYDPEAWAAGEGPILLVEGASDTAAALTMGLAAVGRPSNTAGVRDLTILLRDLPAGRPIVVVGENDDRDGICPGRNGAILTATRLAEKLGRPVLWAMPPAGAKDTREYLRANGPAAGPRFVELLLAGATAISPPGGAEGDPEIERMPDRGPERNLDEWRQESLERRIAALRKPGIYLDRGEVGTGKTKTTIRAISDTDQPSMLWLMPAHANCDELVNDLHKDGIRAVSYPRLDDETCQNLDKVTQAQAIGLIAGAAVCPTCPLKLACEQSGYLALKDKADKSEYRVATISRAAASDAIFRAKSFRKDGIVEEGKPKTWTRGVPDVIVIDERVGDVLAETVTTGLEDLDVAAFILANVATDAPLAQRRYRPQPEHVAYAASLVKVIEAIRSAAENVAGCGVHRVELPPAVAPPRRWQVAFNEWVQAQRSRWDREGAWTERFAAAVRLTTLAATGGLTEVWVAGERRHRLGKVQIEVIGKRLADLPASSKVFLLDADATAEDLAARSGRQIEDITPAGHLPIKQKVRQVPLDVTKAAEPSKTWRIIEAHLHANPSVRRLGVIGHKGAVEAVLGEDDGYLQPWDRERVAMYAGFGTGPDRGSNMWTLACDDLAVIGTPRPPTIRQWLIAHGEIEAAALEDGEWGDLAWEGEATDGRRKVFRCRGPRHPAWRRAARAIHLAAIRQAAGRGRAILPGDAGISVTVYSDQPTGFPVDESIEAAQPAVHEAVEAVAYLARRQAESAQTPREYLGESALSSVLSMRVVDHLMLTGNIGKRWAQRQIDLAVKAGRLERLEGRLIRLAAPKAPAAHCTAARATEPDYVPAASPADSPPKPPPVLPTHEEQIWSPTALAKTR